MAVEIKEDPIEWAKKYNIRLDPITCINCKKQIIPNVPVAIKGYRGLKSLPHGCPDKYSPSRWVPFSDEEKEFWNGLFN